MRLFDFGFETDINPEVNLKPANVPELQKQLAQLNARGERISHVDLSALNRIMEHRVEDMTATVEAGVNLADLQKQLARGGQWLPVDPPGIERLSVGELLAANASGPRRLGYGTIRDYLIGIQVVLADGRLIHSGGKVVKNVAGYDLMKLFIGSHGSLGVIIQATFKVLPLPEMETFVETRCAALDEAGRKIEAVFDSPVTPIVFDLHNLDPESCSLVLGFSGTRDDVEWQLSEARGLEITEPSSLDYAKKVVMAGTPWSCLSVLPSKTIESIGRLKSTAFLAHVGNGIIWHSDRGEPEHSTPNSSLERRLKAEFDPKHIFPALSL